MFDLTVDLKFPIYLVYPSQDASHGPFAIYCTLVSYPLLPSGAAHPSRDEIATRGGPTKDTHDWTPKGCAGLSVITLAVSLAVPSLAFNEGWNKRSRKGRGGGLGTRRGDILFI